MKTIKIELDSDNCELTYCALRDLANRIEIELRQKDAQYLHDDSYRKVVDESLGRLRWIATYLEHMRRDQHK